MLFAQLEYDFKVQIGDKFRINGAKSFVSKGSDAITEILVRPSADIDDADRIDIFDSDEKERHLDWAYTSFEMDIDSTNDLLTISETPGVDIDVTLTSGTYTLSELVGEIETQLNAEGDLTYVVSLSSQDKITVSASGNFSILPGPENIWNQLGFRTTDIQSLSNATSYEGSRVRYLTRKLELEVNNESDPANITFGYLRLYSVEGDNLFSSDSDLTTHEPDILRWLPDGKSSYKYAHRRAQELILAYLDEKGYTDVYQNKLLLDAIVDVEEVAEWSKYLTLKLIFQGLNNAVDDVFIQKANKYNDDAVAARTRAILRLDLDGDGEVEDNSQESVTVSSIHCARR